MPTYVDGLKTEKTIFDLLWRDLQYDYDCAMAKKIKASDTLKKLGASVENFRPHSELFRTKFPTYIDQFPADLPEGFLTFLTKLGGATKALVKKWVLRIKKGVN